MKILIGVDDSAHSKAALEFLGRQTWPKGSKVILLTAVSTPVLAYAMPDMGGVAVFLAEQEQEIYKAAKEMVAGKARALRDAGLDVEARVARGDARDLLVSTAQAEGIDLLIVGSHGRTGLTKLLLGSVASHVVTHAPCSVTVVKLGHRPV